MRVAAAGISTEIEGPHTEVFPYVVVALLGYPQMDGCTIGFMKLGFEWSEIDTAPFFSGILPNLSFPQVSSSYDIGKWWGHP